MGWWVLLAVLALCPDVWADMRSPHTHSEHSHSHETSGQSGEMCTAFRRRCLKGAACANRTCHCPAGMKGNALIECVPEDSLLCTVSADPHLHSYGGARADINIPCRYRLTRYVTNHTTAATPHAFCSVEVYATNELFKGNYLVRSVHISLGVTDSGQQVHQQFEVRKYGVSDDQIYRFLSNVTMSKALWGFGVHDETINGVDVKCDFDHDNNFAVLDVPECATRVKYRAYDRRERRQHLLPGVSIMAPGDAKFVRKYGHYPYALCGTSHDKQDLYVKYAAALGFDDKHLAVLHDVLLESAPQVENPTRESCEAAFATFKASTDRTNDINFCGPILTHKRSRKCLVLQRAVPIDVFTACLRYRQTGAVEDCNLVRGIQVACGPRSSLPLLSC